MTTPDTPFTIEKTKRAEQILDDEGYSNVEQFPKIKKKKSRKGKFMPKVIREGNPIRKPKTKEKPLKKPNEKPFKNPKAKPSQNNKLNGNMEKTSNKRKTHCEYVKRSLTFDGSDSCSGNSEITESEVDLIGSSNNLCVDVNETDASNIFSFTKKKRTIIVRKKCTKDWSAIKWFSDEPVAINCLSSEFNFLITKRKRTRITKRKYKKTCLNNETVDASITVPHFKKRRTLNLNELRNGWINFKHLSSGGFTFEMEKEYKPVLDKVEKGKHVVDGFIVYSRRKLSTQSTSAKPCNMNCTLPSTPQKVLMCKVNEQNLELEDSKHRLENRTTEALRPPTQPSVIEDALKCSEILDFQFFKCIPLDENEVINHKPINYHCTHEYEIHELEASNQGTENTSKIDARIPPPTPAKPVRRNFNENSVSDFGPLARVELIVAQQLKLKGRTREMKKRVPCLDIKRVPRLDITASNSNLKLDFRKGGMTYPSKINSSFQVVSNSHKQRTVTYKIKRVTKRDILGITQRLKYLKLDVRHETAVVPYSSGDGTLAPLLTKKRKLQGKVDLDPESDRMWELLMTSGIDYETLDEDGEKEKWWEEQRRAMYRRIESFIMNMELILGDREFSPWKGSVVDSVVGVYLTQNVSDHLSSSAFMSLAARFPLHPKCANGTANPERTSDPETFDAMKSSSSIVTPICQDIRDLVTIIEIECIEKHTYSHEEGEIGGESGITFQDSNSNDGLSFVEECKLQKVSAENSSNEEVENEKEEAKALHNCDMEQTCKNLLALGKEVEPEDKVDDVAEQIDAILGSQKSNNINNVNSDKACYSHNVLADNLCNASKDESENNYKKVHDLNILKQNCEANSLFEQRESVAVHQVDSVVEQSATCMNSQYLCENNLKSDKTSNSEKDSSENSSSVSEEKVVKEETSETHDWDNLRKQAFENGAKRERSRNALDSLDYEALRCADNDVVAEAIKERGQNNILARKIKNFLDRTVNIHGSIDLEWLRNVPLEKAKEYLLDIDGLGIKSVECVRLLTLHHRAFPVDTNVGRICVRLGWVPLQPLPDSVQLHLLEQYPVQETIQKYLWPRLCKLDHRTLYKLHYLLIAAGKVFCTKIKPNCNACPMRGECKHFASAFASTRLALPGPNETCLVGRSISSQNCPIPNPMPLPHQNSLLQNQTAQNREPIIQEPASPEPIHEESIEMDIEDFGLDEYDDDGIPTIKLNMEEFTCNLKSCMQDMNIEGDVSQALVSLTPEAASIPQPKLKNVARMRTVHAAYELEDTSPILEGFEKRDPGDPCPYILAIWTPGETSESTDVSRVCCNLKDGMCNMTTCFCCNSKREAQAGTVRGTILIPCRTANRGSFPLNGTYFQVNEVFADHYTSHTPLNVPTKLLWSLKRAPVYVGTSVTSMLKGLTTGEVQLCFWKGYVCVRAYDRETRRPKALSPRLHLSAAMAATKMKEQNKGKGRRSTRIYGKTANIINT